MARLVRVSLVDIPQHISKKGAAVKRGQYPFFYSEKRTRLELFRRPQTS
jgi:hypothetical protein